MSDGSTDRQVRVRRGPKVVRFLAVGGGLGAIATFIDIGVTPKDADYSTAQAFGFIALVLVPIGVTLGGVLAIVLDRGSIRRSRLATAQHTRSGQQQQAAADSSDAPVDPAPSTPPSAVE